MSLHPNFQLWKDRPCWHLSVGCAPSVVEPWNCCLGCRVLGPIWSATHESWWWPLSHENSKHISNMSFWSFFLVILKFDMDMAISEGSQCGPQICVIRGFWWQEAKLRARKTTGGGLVSQPCKSGWKWTRKSGHVWRNTKKIETRGLIVG